MKRRDSRLFLLFSDCYIAILKLQNQLLKRTAAGIEALSGSIGAFRGCCRALYILGASGVLGFPLPGLLQRLFSCGAF